MTGLEKIIEQIKNESEETAKSIRLSAEAEAKTITGKAQIDAAEFRRAASEKIQKQAQDLKARSKSAAVLQERRILLNEKLQIIEETVADSRNDLLNLPAEEYFKVLLKIIAKYALPEKGEIFLNSKDLQRMPKDFAEKADAQAKESGGTLNLSLETKLISGGLILSYGGIEENCSFEALFDAQKEQMQDKAATLLFPEGD
ncbi:V-type ATP synthase subunit E [Caproicibacterium sp. NSD3]